MSKDAEKQERIRAAREHYEARKIGRPTQTASGCDSNGWTIWRRTRMGA